jgi:hypothetical protein
MRTMLAPLLLLAASAAFAQGMYSQPYAIVERGDRSDVNKEATVAITKVDGKSTRDARRTDPIPPGKHVITVHFDTARGGFRPEYRDLEMDLEPCKLYRIVAKYENRLGPDWEARVSAQPLGDCERKFSKKK